MQKRYEINEISRTTYDDQNSNQKLKNEIKLAKLA